MGTVKKSVYADNMTDNIFDNTMYEKYTGLSDKEAKKRLTEHGPNLLSEKEKISPIKILFRQFTDVMIIILLASTAISAFLGEMVEAVTIIAIVLLNAVLGFIQEYRTERTMEALKGLTAPEAKVLRDGKAISIPAEEVVPGDVILLETGDKVPADAILLDCVNLQSDESLLTGESLPVDKMPAHESAVTRSQKRGYSQAKKRLGSEDFFEDRKRFGDSGYSGVPGYSEVQRVRGDSGDSGIPGVPGVPGGSGVPGYSEVQRVRGDSGDSNDKNRRAGKGYLDEEGYEKDRERRVFMGTVITGGRGRGVVYATGMDTEMGGIAGLIKKIEEDSTPLQKRLEKLGKVIVAGCLGICAIVAVTGVIRGEDAFSMLLTGISLAVAAVPEGLPALVTISLALGVQRMLKRNALVRRLPAVETLGCAGVVCSDKTGTLTQNRMTVRKIYAGSSIVDVGDGTKEKAFSSGGRGIEPLKNDILKLVLEIGVLCNNAVLKVSGAAVTGKTARSAGFTGSVGKFRTGIRQMPVPEREFTGDPTEGALLLAGVKAGLTQDLLLTQYFRIDELPFDSNRKCMSVVCKNQRGELYVFSKGAPEELLDKCTGIITPGGVVPINQIIKMRILKVNDNMAKDALRVIAVACKRLKSGIWKRDELETGLVFAGLTGIQDPPREEAFEAVQKCIAAGIRPVMVTGDYKLTAVSIAKELDIYKEDEGVITGAELDYMDESEFVERVEDINVYARVTPKHKLMIVQALRKKGHIVAMTGDGVNDAPAVKEADIGVAMGISGTDVTKEASSMVLLDDNFATIVAAIEEGRVIYNNIRKFIRYMLACNIGEVLTMFLGMLAGLPIPLFPIHILWINLVTDGLPAIALGFDPPEEDVMKRPSRRPDEGIFSDGLAVTIPIRGVLIGLTTLTVFISMLFYGGDVAAARTGAFVTLIITQLIHVFECKSETKSLFQIQIFNNVYLILAVLCSLFMTLGVIYIPGLQRIFKTVPLSLNDWMIAGGLSLLVPVLAGFFPHSRRAGGRAR